MEVPAQGLRQEPHVLDSSRLCCRRLCDVQGTGACEGASWAVVCPLGRSALAMTQGRWVRAGRRKGLRAALRLSMLDLTPTSAPAESLAGRGDSVLLFFKLRWTCVSPSDWSPEITFPPA